MLTARDNAVERTECRDNRMTNALLRISGFATTLAGIVTLAMTLTIILDVTMRAIHTPLPSALELVTVFWMPGVALLALCHTQLRNEQIRVSFLVDATRDRSKKVAETIPEVIAAAAVAWMLWLAVQHTIASFTSGDVTASLPAIPLWPGQALVCLAFALTVVTALGRIYVIWAGVEHAINPVRDAVEGEVDFSE